MSQQDSVLKTVRHDFEDKAELYGTLKYLCKAYPLVTITVVSQYNNGKPMRRDVDREALHLRDDGTLDICGYPATGRFPSVKNVQYIEVRKDE